MTFWRLLLVLVGTQISMATLALSYERKDAVFEGEFYRNYSTLQFFMGAIHTGSHPKGANFSPDGRWLYVANMYSPFTTVIDMAALEDDPSFGGVEIQGRREIFASNKKVAKQVSQWIKGFPSASQEANPINISLLRSPEAVVHEVATPYGHEKTKAQSIEVSFSKDSQFAFVSQMETSQFKNAGRVSVFETRTKKLIAEIPTRGTGSKIIGISAQRDRQGRRVAYVTNWFDRTLSILDISRNSLEELASRPHVLGEVNSELFIKKLKIPSHFERTGGGRFGVASRGVAFTNDGLWAIVTNFDSRTVFIIDAQTHQPIAELPPVPSRHGGPSSMRHIVISDDDSVAYISMMGRNALLKVNLERLRELIPLTAGGNSLTRPSEKIWDQILSQWGAGYTYLKTNPLSLDHTLPAKLRGGWTASAHPNTIALSPGNQRYLYVSNRSSKLQEGKVDVVDTERGKIIFSLSAGAHPTALALSRSGCVLVSSEFENRRLLRFYDVCRLQEIYETLHPALGVQ